MMGCSRPSSRISSRSLAPRATWSYGCKSSWQTPSPPSRRTASSGPQTLANLRSFQAAHRITPTGQTDPVTWHALLRLRAVTVRRAAGILTSRHSPHQRTRRRLTNRSRAAVSNEIHKPSGIDAAPLRLRPAVPPVKLCVSGGAAAFRRRLRARLPPSRPWSPTGVPSAAEPPAGRYAGRSAAAH